MRAATLLALAWVLPGVEDLALAFPASVRVFGTWELDLRGTGSLAWLHELPGDQVHDAHDADRDDRWLRLRATLTGADGRSVTVPGFAMREEPGGPWRWRVLWGPRRAGTWDLLLTLRCARGDGRVRTMTLRRPGAVTVTGPALPGGPLLAPAADQPGAWLRELAPDGSSRAIWLFGAWRAWVVEDGPVWPEHIDRATELLAPMRAAGYNLLGQWHAPWEYQLVHHDRAEWWRTADGGWERHAIPDAVGWSAWRSLDQGRAADFDRLLRLCEGDAQRPLVRLLLAPLPHGSFMMRGHPWGGQESGWSPADDGGLQPPHKLNGFSAFRDGMDAWDFFAADPDGEEAWQRRLFDAQANYFRYLVARWGHSRAIGVWVLLDEVDGMGELVGEMAEGTGWWARPACATWLGNAVRWFRGELPAREGDAYLGDPYRHPLHVAATSLHEGPLAAGANLEWTAGPEPVRPDLLGWHWYPAWPWNAPVELVWDHVVRGVVRYGRFARTRLARPVLASEFGAYDRLDPERPPSTIYPSLYHFGVWSSLFAGHAGTVMDWDDGKEFGELRWREGAGAFSRERYPVDNAARLRALRTFLGDLSPEGLACCLDPDTPVAVAAAGRATALALYARGSRDAIYGWCFDPDAAPRLRVTGLAPGAYRLRWYDPWTGEAIGEARRLETADGILDLDGVGILAALPGTELAYPDETRLGKGHDLAFKLRCAR